MLSKRNGSGDSNGTASLAFSVSSPYTFDVASLSPGTYYAYICPTGSAEGSASCRYSSGRFDVNGIPTVTVTAPTEEGSTDDFATVQLNNAWDFDATTDIDYYQNIASLSTDFEWAMACGPAARVPGAGIGMTQTSVADVGLTSL